MLTQLFLSVRSRRPPLIDLAAKRQKINSWEVTPSGVARLRNGIIQPCRKLVGRGLIVDTQRKTTLFRIHPGP
jgi:hypothetical protein